MSDQKLVGKLDAVQNVTRIRYSPATGWSYSGKIEGPKAAVKPLLNGLAAAGYELEFSSDQSPKAEITFSSAGDPGGDQAEEPTASWEYFANRVEIDVLEADLPGQAISGIAGQGALNAIDQDERAAIRAAIQSPVEGQSPALTSAAAIDLYRLMLSGVRNFRVNLPTLRVSRLVSNSYAVQASQANVGRLLETASLILQESPPTRLFALPAWTSTKTGFRFAWLKGPPEIVTAGYRWRITQDWEYGLWPTLIYGNAL